MTIIKRESAAMGRNHGCDAYAAPCDDPEDQMVVSNGSEGSGEFFTGGLSSVGRDEESIVACA